MNIAICYIQAVQLIGRDKIQDFKKKHPTSRKALDRFVKLVEGSDAKAPKDLKSIFGGNVDFVGQHTVFDVGGNKVRVISKINYGALVLIVTHVLTHDEYDQNRWKR